MFPVQYKVCCFSVVLTNPCVPYNYIFAAKHGVVFQNLFFLIYTLDNWNLYG